MENVFIGNYAGWSLEQQREEAAAIAARLFKYLGWAKFENDKKRDEILALGEWLENHSKGLNR